MIRTLSAIESATLRSSLQRRWDWDGGYWHPLHELGRSDVLAFDAAGLEQAIPESELRRVLVEAGDQNLVLLREQDPDQLLELDEVEFLYGHSEAFLGPTDLRWLLYWSHEETITFAGDQLLIALKKAVPGWQTLVWS